MDDNKIIIYTSTDGKTKIDVKLEDETLWLTQAQMCELYQSSRTNVLEHIQHIYEEGELQETATCRKFRQVRQEGNRSVTREVACYNLDMIIALGYRIKSIIATRFRQWATARLKEYMIKGFTLDDDRLKNLGGGNYWKELLDRIRDIRVTEKVFYRQVLEIYANMAMAYSSLHQYQEDYECLMKARRMGLDNPSIEKELRWLRNNVGIG